MIDTTMRSVNFFAFVLALACAGCASGDPVASKSVSAAPATSADRSRKDDAELVTGSRIPVRGAQPVRTIDKEEIMRDSRVIGVPPKGN